MTTEVTQDEAVVEKQSVAIKAIHDAHKELDALAIGTPEFAKFSSELEIAVLDLARLHRNWNEATGSPDGMYEDLDEDEVEGVKAPAFARDELTTVEELSEEILYDVRMINFKAPTFGSIGTFANILSNHIFDLVTHHPDYNYDRGEIES